MVTTMYMQSQQPSQHDLFVYSAKHDMRAMFECQLSNNLQQVKRIFFVLEEYVSDNLTNIKISEGMQKTIPPTYCIFYILTYLNIYLVKNMFVDIIIMYLTLKYLVMSENCQEERLSEQELSLKPFYFLILTLLQIYFQKLKDR